MEIIISSCARIHLNAVSKYACIYSNPAYEACICNNTAIRRNALRNMLDKQLSFAYVYHINNTSLHLAICRNVMEK